MEAAVTVGGVGMAGTTRHGMKILIEASRGSGRSKGNTREGHEDRDGAAAKARGARSLWSPLEDRTPASVVACCVMPRAVCFSSAKRVAGHM